MAMGNTGTVNVTPEMINNAKDAIQGYCKNSVFSVGGYYECSYSR